MTVVPSKKALDFSQKFMVNRGFSILYNSSSTRYYHDNNPVAKQDEI